MTEPKQVQVVPATRSDERMHDMDADCWCRPLNEFVPDLTGRNEWVVRHRNADGGFAERSQ